VTRDVFAAIQIGDKASVYRDVRLEDLDRFVVISGDSSAIHVSEDAAIARGFKGRVAHGALLTSWVSSIIGTQLPGDGGVLQSISMSFRAPVVPPETIQITVAVSGKSEAVRQLKLSISIMRSDGVLAASGEARSIVK
jgi:acyl dehydratase